jgi:hypothetical protein
MERFAFTDVDGVVLYIAAPAIDGVYTDGQVVNGQTARLLPDDAPDNITLINTYYYKDEWKKRAPRPTASYYSWDSNIEQWVPNLKLVRAAKNVQIDAALVAANQSGFTYGNSKIATDSLSRSHMDAINGFVALFDKMPLSWDGIWKTEVGTTLSVPNAVAWKNFYSAMVTQLHTNFVKAEGLKAALAAATTIQQVEAITW